MNQTEADTKFQPGDLVTIKPEMFDPADIDDQEVLDIALNKQGVVTNVYPEEIPPGSGDSLKIYYYCEVRFKDPEQGVTHEITLQQELLNPLLTPETEKVFGDILRDV